ncbi:MAG: hypothetical protein II299_05730 [Alistipes sp.]|nr:hypothetical protein [Alistipes sp.]
MWLDVISIISPIIVLTLFVLYIIWAERQGEKLNNLEKEEKRKKAEEQKALAESEFNAKIDAISNKYGKPDKIIRLNEYRYIAVCAQQQIICINSTEGILFKDILSSKIIDNYQIKHGRITGDATTSTSTSSLVGRSAAGALVGGGIGAVIGASSASKNTSVNYTQSNDKLIHDYILVITLNRFDSSIIKVQIGNDWETASEIEHIFALINGQNIQIENK